MTAIAALLVVSACGADNPSPDGSKPLVVATTSIIGDVVQAAFGPGVGVEVLIPASQDPHGFSAAPAQVARLREADLVVANGLGLEEGLIDVLAAAERDGVEIVALGEQTSPLSSGDRTDGEAPDPHFWLDPIRMAAGVDAVAAALTRVAPADASSWMQQSGAYRAQLEVLDADIRSLVAAIPPELRLLVTTHDSLRYFADSYGLEVVGTVVPGTSTLAEPSAADLADLIEILRTTEISAIFADTTRPTRLADVVAGEIGRDISVVELYTGGLGAAGSGADTYVGYMRTNAELIVQALSA